MVVSVFERYLFFWEQKLYVLNWNSVVILKDIGFFGGGIPPKLNVLFLLFVWRFVCLLIRFEISTSNLQTSWKGWWMTAMSRELWMISVLPRSGPFGMTLIKFFNSLDAEYEKIGRVWIPKEGFRDTSESAELKCCRSSKIFSETHEWPTFVGVKGSIR